MMRERLRRLARQRLTRAEWRAQGAVKATRRLETQGSGEYERAMAMSWIQKKILELEARHASFPR